MAAGDDVGRDDGQGEGDFRRMDRRMPADASKQC